MEKDGDQPSGEGRREAKDTTVRAPSERFKRGLDYLRRNQMDLAAAEFEESLERNPDDAPARFGLGCVHAIKGLRDRAVEEWTRCIEIEPGFAEAHYALSWAYYDASDPQRGYEHLREAMDTGVPLDSIRDLMDRFVRTERLRSDEGEGERPRDISPSRTVEEGRPSEEGEKEPEEEEAEDLASLYRRGVLALRRGSTDEAIEILERLVSSGPDRPDFHFALGGAYSAKGAWQNAVEEWRRTVELDPGSRDAHHNLAVAFRRMGLREQAEYHASIAEGLPSRDRQRITDQFWVAESPPARAESEEISREMESIEDRVQEIEAVSVEQVQVEAPRRPRAEGILALARYHKWDILAMGVIVGLCYFLLRGTLREGYPRAFLDGTMAYYITKVEMLLNDFTFFTESWYFGFELLRFYPPLSAIIPYLAAVVTGKPILSYYFMSFFFYAFFCLGVYLFTSRFLNSRSAGLYAGAVWALTHSNVISFQGHYWEIARLMGTAALPWFLMSLDSAIRTGRKRWVLTGVGLASYTLLTNMYSAFDLVLFAIPFLLIRGMLVPVEEPPESYQIGRRTRKIIGAGLIGVLALVFWWYLPAVLPYGAGGYFVGGGGTVPGVPSILLQFHPPDWMPATQLPVTILGLLGVAIYARRKDAEGFTLITWLILTVILAYFIRLQSVRMLSLISLSLVFLGAYFVCGFVDVIPKLSVRLTDRGRHDLPAILAFCIVVIFIIQYIPIYTRYATVDNDYLFTDEYKTALWLRDRVGQDYRVYVMYGNNYRGAQWINAFSPETKQVLGGMDLGAYMVDRTPFLFDDMVKGGADADELHEYAVEYHVKYVVIDDSFMKGSGPSYMKFYEEEHFRSADEINGELVFAKVFEVNGVEPLPEMSVSYHYWDRWRVLGIAGTILLIPLFLIISKKLELSLV